MTSRPNRLVTGRLIAGFVGISLLLLAVAPVFAATPSASASLSPSAPVMVSSSPSAMVSLAPSAMVSSSASVGAMSSASAVSSVLGVTSAPSGASLAPTNTAPQNTNQSNGAGGFLPFVLLIAIVLAGAFTARRMAQARK